MDFRICVLSLLIAPGLSLPQLCMGAVVFKAGEKAKYVAPGDEEISGNAEELFHKAQVAEKEGNLKRAVRAYRTLVRRHPKDALAPGAVFHAAELLEQLHQYLPAAESYRTIVERYPSSPRFNEAIEAQFRIGELYLNGKKVKTLLGISFGNALDYAVEIFAAVVRTAPYGKYTARAQFDIGLAREKQGLNDAALQAYQAVIDKFPNEPVAADAQYQIGYIWFTAARSGTKDVAATHNAKTAFQDFLFRYQNSEKTAQTRANLQLLERKETTSSFQVAKFYDKQKNYRAAVIYYNEVIRQQPGSTESERAKKRIDQLRAKVGDAALQPPAVASGTAQKKPGPQQKTDTAKTESASEKSSSTSKSPLPPADTDAALPPPASLLPDTTTAPEPPASSEASSTPEGSPATDGSASPESSPSPAP